VSSAPSHRALAERQRRRGASGRARLTLALLLAVSLVLWIFRAPILRGVGGVLVAEDALAPVDVIAVSHANVRASALEAAALYRQGLGRRVVVAECKKDELDARLRELGVPYPASHELVVAILERSGVPRSAITVLPGAVDGTNPEIAVYVRFARREKPATLLYVTSRSHTARAGRRLRREAPGTRILVHASRWDDFDVDTWWHRRGSTREVMTEYLRWFNTFVLGDYWRSRSVSGAGDGLAPQEAAERP
jgi:uncharacterized SAM-binding protein YcdF (DUF218 family)